MYDRPTLTELLQAVEYYLEHQVTPAVRQDPRMYFHTLVAQNLLRIAVRELNLEEKHLHDEWERLNGIQGVEIPVPAALRDLRTSLARRNQLLAEEIRIGDYDEPTPRALLLAHLLATVREKLEVSHPQFLQITDDLP